MNNKVIYTCVTGGYDKVRQPKTVYDEYDYICFTDKCAESKIGVWQIKPIPYQSNDNTRLARFVKHNPHIVVPEYKYSIWIDSNIQILDSYLDERVQLMIKQESKVAQIKHPKRICIYEEAKRCLLRTKDNAQTICKTIEYIKNDGYPSNNGLTETNIIFRVHNDPQIVELSKEWWNFISAYSKRDQLSFFYVLWKLDLSVDQFFDDDVNANTTLHFIRSSHNLSLRQQLIRVIKVIKNYGLFIFKYKNLFTVSQ